MSQALKLIVLESLDGKSVKDFVNFDDFYKYLEVCFHYEELDSGERLSHHIKDLRRVFNQLVSEEQCVLCNYSGHKSEFKKNTCLNCINEQSELED